MEHGTRGLDSQLDATAATLYLGQGHKDSVLNGEPLHHPASDDGSSFGPLDSKVNLIGAISATVRKIFCLITVQSPFQRPIIIIGQFSDHFGQKARA